MKNYEEMAKKVLEVTKAIYGADHIDVKLFIGYCGAEELRRDFVEAYHITQELNAIEEFIEIVDIALMEYSYVMFHLRHDIEEKLNKKGANTFTSADENYEIAKWFNEGFFIKTGLKIYNK